MFFAVFRILFIFVATVLILIGGILGLRTLGSKTEVTELNHPLFAHNPWLIIKGGDQEAGPAQSQTALLAAAQINKPNIFLGISLRQTQDGYWVLYEPSRLEELTNGNGFVTHTTRDEFKKLNFKLHNEAPLTLEEVFVLLPTQNFYIEVLQPANPNLQKIFKLIEEQKRTDKVILTSPFADTLREIRNQSGLWLTGSSTAELTKARFMSSIYLESIVDLPGDLFVVDIQSSPRLIAELKRRHKVLAFNEPSPTIIDNGDIAAGRTAFITTRPNKYRHLVDPTN